MSTWHAAGAFRLALRAQECGDYRRARVMYSRVLDLVPDHLPALHNLAVAELRRRRYARSMQLTDRALADRELQRQMDGDKWPELGYALWYNRALAQTLAASRNGEIDRPVASEAVGHGCKLVRQLLRRLDVHDQQSVRSRWPRRQGPTPVDEDELLMLKKIELPAIALLADIVLRSVNDDAVWEQAARETLDSQTAQIVDRPTLLAGLGEDPPPPAWSYAAERYARANAVTSARAHYNLACYRGRILEALPVAAELDDLRERLVFNALEDLADALVDESLIVWATMDPALKGVRAYEGWAAFLRFQQEEALDLEAAATGG